MDVAIWQTRCSQANKHLITAYCLLLGDAKCFKINVVKCTRLVTFIHSLVLHNSMDEMLLCSLSLSQLRSMRVGKKLFIRTDWMNNTTLRCGVLAAAAQSACIYRVQHKHTPRRIRLPIFIFYCFSIFIFVSP